ncbi:TerC family protein [Nigerium massiliense]|uniref:TerC family protein n=1 Tax=Nigerium massiliense TaxID=1522317 RepID=UPI00058AFB00|nr:TerC family protein [Nigerium massiliense]
MVESPLTWALTIAGIVGLLAFDFFFHVRKAHIPTIKEAAKWTGIYVSIAVLFGIGILVFGGFHPGLEFFAGYITEMSLSVDNLFVFLIIMSSFKVPRADQQKVLMFGIVVSLIFRSAFIFLGVALINSFAWIFYFFGLILLVTAGNLLKPEQEETDGEASEANNFIIRIAKKFIHTTDYYDGDKLFTQVDGRRAMTPMLLVMIAIGGTDVMFALDSIPAIFGLTQDPYIVFTAVAFSLLGLRQLYFLIDGLLDRLIYLKYGLAAILAFIGVKLILHALHENSVPFINDGQPVPVVEVTTQLSLIVIVGVLLIVIVASLASPKGKALTTINNTRRHAQQYLDLDYEADLSVREQNYKQLVREEQALLAIPAKYKPLIRGENELLDMLDEAHRQHGDYVDRNPTRFPAGDPAQRFERLDTERYRESDAEDPEEPSGE